MKKLDSRLAGFLRGLALALASAAILFATEFLKTGNNVPESFSLLVPVLLTVLRTAEGFIDNAKAVPAAE